MCPMSCIKWEAVSQPRAEVPMREHKPSIAKSLGFLKDFFQQPEMWSFGMKSLDL